MSNLEFSIGKNIIPICIILSEHINKELSSFLVQLWNAVRRWLQIVLCSKVFLSDTEGICVTKLS